MTVDVLLNLAILVAAVFLFVTDWLRADLVALLVLVTLVLTGLVSPEESISGFSNPAVVTIWAMFILSAGLSRTGVASWMGRQVLRLAGKTDSGLLAMLTGSAAALSSFMNNIGVAAMFLPVTTDIARRTQKSVSWLMLPMAYGCLLGGMLTLIGTSSNLVVADFLRETDLPPLGLFDFTPIGFTILVAAILYMALFGRHLLPTHRGVESRPADGGSRPHCTEHYGLEERLAVVAIPATSLLVGRTLAESRIGPALGLNVLRVQRKEGRRHLPTPDLILEGGDRLLVLGRLEAVNEIINRPLLTVEDTLPAASRLLSDGIGLVELAITSESPFNGKTVVELDMRGAYGLNILAVMRGGRVRRSNLQDLVFRPGDVVLAQGPLERLESLRSHPGYRRPGDELVAPYKLDERLLSVRIPEGSPLAGRSLRESRLAVAFGITVLALCRDGEDRCMPLPETTLQEGDLLIVEGRSFDLKVLRGLQELTVERKTRFDLRDLEDGPLGVVEVMLSPHTTLAGKTIRQLRLREKYGISVLAVWRGDRPYRTELGDLALDFGDAFLCYGSRESFELLAGERDFVVLNLAVQQEPRLGKAPLAVLIMALVLTAVLTGLLPIPVAAIAGAVLMVLTRCLSMEEAHRAIEWKVVFLIAAMLPMGHAMQQTGTASLLGGLVVEATGPFGPVAVLAGLIALGFALSPFIPSPVNAVVMTPIALATASAMELSPYPFLMGVAYAVASGFLTPVSHPVNALVMSPGNLRFNDYLKNGLPFALIVLVICVTLLPLLFPF